MTSPDVPFTNNLAERDIRMTKCREKVSGGSRSIDGIQFFSRIRGYLSTCAKYGLSASEALQILSSGRLPDFVNLSDVPEDKAFIPLSNALKLQLKEKITNSTPDAKMEQSE